MNGPAVWRPRVVVCGTGFGRIYLSALRRPGLPFELAGILARGSRRSRDCASEYGVPLYSDVDDLPSTVDIACVVVGAGINGGPGAQLAQLLMGRGIHVLQEHPLHHAELAACLRRARERRVQYRLNTQYVHMTVVRRFVGAARRLLRGQPALFVDALTSFQVLYPLFDILGQALGGVRPWSFDDTPAGSGVLRALAGTFAGVPVTLRVQNELDPAERDNGGHVAHRITLATEGGNLLLANTHGPVLWNPRLHMPAGDQDATTMAASPSAHLDLPATGFIGPPAAPTHREVIREEWPLACARALLDLRRAILAGEDPLPLGQRHLALCRVTAAATDRLGPPALHHPPAPRILQAAAAVTGHPRRGRSRDDQPAQRAGV
jgi:pyochelin biosynthesis protein PchG